MLSWLDESVKFRGGDEMISWDSMDGGEQALHLARWANTHKSALEAVTVIAHLTALSRELRAFAASEIEGEADDAH